MEKNLEQWREIAELINKDKQRALADFQRREFVPGTLPEPGRRMFLRPAIMAAAASLLLAAGLISFWMLRGSWRKAPAAPAWNEILADSLFNSGYGQPDTESAAQASTAAASPFFTAWAEAGLERRAVAAAAVDPAAPVEHGDPDDLRRKIGRAIKKGAFERLLIHFQEFHDKEA